MAGAPDLFVVCKNCGSEVSPYITECPYCGTRLRKRAPKIERDAGDAAPRQAAARGAPDAEPAAHQRDPRHPRRPDGPAERDVRAAVLLSLFGFLVAARSSRDADVALV